MEILWFLLQAVKQKEENDMRESNIPTIKRLPFSTGMVANHIYNLDNLKEGKLGGDILSTALGTEKGKT